MKKTAKQHYTEATETCLMVGSDDGVWSRLLISAYCCVFLHYLLVYTNQPRVLVAIKGYDSQYLCKQNG
jgi:hypothetical protein